MRRTSLRVVRLGLAVMTMALLLASPGYAARAGQAAGGAAGGTDTWYALPAGASAEWVFRYLGNNDRALIALGASPVAAIAVNVYEDAQWRALGNGDTSVIPVGKGTAGTLINWDAYKDVIARGNLFWEAKAKPGVTFHIQVVNTSKQDAQYWIAQVGPAAGGLSSASAVSPVQAGQPLQPTAAPTAEAPRTLPVAGDSGVLVLCAVGMPLIAGGWLTRRWND